ncbi:MAG: hypothetical protein KDH96_13815, partial [Candidatus Riesia sp.]|nr:hypothetical protein [Candidatus Riesia sp.]
LIDPSYALESNARIQIQYRLRIIENVNLSTYADGLDDPSVVAYTTSDFGGAGADGSATVRTFAKSADDPGLWIAGNGDSTDATLFGSVDGYMYATPVCAITRRNSTAFDRATNMNGGVTIASGTSDRPDGLFYDQIVADDILDLRRGRSGEIQDILQKMTYQVFSNTLA